MDNDIPGTNQEQFACNGLIGSDYFLLQAKFCLSFHAPLYGYDNLIVKVGAIVSNFEKKVKDLQKQIFWFTIFENFDSEIETR